jgi:hypothetical protein
MLCVVIQDKDRRGGGHVRSTDTAPRDASEPLLVQLRRAGALTALQAEWLAERWEGLPDDWASHPYCRQIGEHTRAYIDLERAAGFVRGPLSHKRPTSTQKEPNHG